MKFNKFVIFILFVAAMAVLLTGCGGRSYSVSGRVIDATGDGFPGVTITAGGKTPISTKTDEKGNWRLDGIKGTVTIAASLTTDWVFEPVSKEISAATDNVNFCAQFPVIVEKVGKGNVRVYPEKIGYEMGEKVTLTVNDVPVGWKFSNWSGSYNGSDESFTIYVQGPIRVKAFFEQNEGVLVFADENLEGAVRRAINKPIGIITKTDVEELSFLNASVTYIQSLKGIENLAGLTWLDLSVTGTTQITQLSNLLSLEYLNLASNQIVDTSALKSLAQLGELYLNNNKIIDISSLSWLANKSLLKLDLSNNQIQKVEALKDIVTIEKLMLANNQIADISPLVKLTKLKELDLSNNSVDKISALNYMKSLEKLNLRKNMLTVIDSITWLKDGSIRELNLSENLISNINKLGGLITIEKLNLSSNQVTDITELGKLIQLRELNLSNNQIEDISSLASLTLVEKLYLHKNKIKDIKPLMQMTSLKEVTLMDNELNLSTGLEDWTVVEELRKRGILIRYDYYQNDAPIIKYPDYEEKIIKEAEEQTFTVQASDPNRDEMTFSAEGELAGFFDPATQVFSWVPTYDDAGEHSVTFVVQDRETTTKKTVIYKVENVNRAPVFTPAIGNKEVQETNLLTFTISAVDPDGEDVTYSVEGDLTDYFDLDTLTFNWQTGYLDKGTYQITFKATDNNADDPKTGSETVTVTVTNKNRLPVFNAVVLPEVITETDLVTFTVSAQDEDPEDILVYSASGQLTEYFNPETGEFIWQTDYTDAGTYTISFEVFDGTDRVTKQVIVTVQDKDRPPVFDPALEINYVVDEYSELTFTLLASDPDGDTVTFGAVDLPANASLNARTGEFRWIPTVDDIGSRIITFTATSKGSGANLAINIIINNVEFAPELLPIGNKTITEGQELSFTLQVLEKDRDEITAFATGDFAHMFDPLTLTFSWTPSYDLCTNVNPVYVTTLRFTVRDNKGNEDSEEITITVNNGNRLPDISFSIDPVPVDPDVTQVITVNENQRIYFQVMATDLDGDNVKLMISGQHSDSYNMTTGIFDWTPGWFDAGEYTLMFTANDGKVSRSRYIKLVVNNVDRDPTIQAIANRTVNEYDKVSFVVVGSDPDGDKVTYSYTTNMGVLQNASLNQDTGLFTWTPNNTYAGLSVDITFIATANGKSVGTTTRVTVTDIQFSPLFISPVEAGLAISEGQLLRFQVLAEDNDKDPLTYSISFPKDGDGQEVYPEDVRTLLTNSFNVDTGWFEWTPGYAVSTSTQTTAYTIYFNVTDSINPSVQKQLTITVNNTDRKPVIIIDSVVNNTITWIKDSGLQRFNVVATDADGEFVTLVATGIPQPDRTTDLPNFAKTDGLAEARGEFSWNPTIDDVGSYEMTFTATSGNASQSQTIRLVIQGTRLSVTSLTVRNEADNNGTILRPEQDLRVDGVIKNSGNVTTGQFGTKWEILSKDGDEDWVIRTQLPPPVDASNQEILVGPLQPNTSGTISHVITAEQLHDIMLPYGSYWIRLTADPLTTNGGPATYEVPFTYAPPLRTVTVTSSNVVAGIVRIAVGEAYQEGSSVSVTVEEGTTITLSALPLDGYMFVGWSGIDSTNTPVPVNVLSSMNITANFDPVTLPRKLAFVSKRNKLNGEMFIMSTVGGLTSITEYYDLRDIGVPKWSPNGFKVLFDATDATGRRDIYLYDVNTEVLTNVTRNTGGSINKSPSWSPDGSLFAYATNAVGENLEIYVRKADGSLFDVAPRVTYTTADEDKPIWSPDSLTPRIVCVTTENNKKTLTMWTLNNQTWTSASVNGDSTTAPQGENPVWSPDGKKIAFEYLNDIYTVEFLTNNEWYIKRVTNNGAINRNPSWAYEPSNSRRLVYESNRNGNYDLFIATATGTGTFEGATISQITFGVMDETNAKWSSDNQRIVYVSREPGALVQDQELYLVNPTDNSIMQITTNEADDYSPGWAPN